MALLPLLVDRARPTVIGICQSQQAVVTVCRASMLVEGGALHADGDTVSQDSKRLDVYHLGGIRKTAWGQPCKAL